MILTRPHRFGFIGFQLACFAVLFCVLLGFAAHAQTVIVDHPAPKTALEMVIAYILVPLIPILGTLLAAALGKLVTFLHAKEGNSKIAAAFAVATDFVNTAFTHLRAGIEPDLKMALADGTLDAVERANLVTKLVALVKAELPAGLMGVLSATLGPALDTWLSGKAGQVIQAAVAEPATGVAAIAQPLEILKAAGMGNLAVAPSPG